MPFEYAKKASIEKKTLVNKIQNEKVDKKAVIIQYGNAEDIKVTEQSNDYNKLEKPLYISKKNSKKLTIFKKLEEISGGVYVGIFFLVIFGFFFKIIKDNYSELNKIHQVKAVILEKNPNSNLIIYKNTEGNIFRIPNALQFWDCGKEGTQF